MMKNIRLSIKEFCRAVKQGMTDEQLKERFRLSAKSLYKVKRSLLAGGYLSSDALRAQGTPVVPPKRTIVAREFVTEFRRKPDDFHLMEKFQLKPKHLKEVYDTLMAKDWISEYEYHAREVKCRDLRETGEIPQAASTIVTLLREQIQSDAPLPNLSREPGDMPSSFFRDVTGVEFGRTGEEARVIGGPREIQATTSTVIEVLTTELCPKCAHPKTSQSETVCEKCGVVFAKLKRKP